MAKPSAASQISMSDMGNIPQKGWQAIAKLKPLSLFIFLLSMLIKALDNVKIGKWKVKVVTAFQ